MTTLCEYHQLEILFKPSINILLKSWIVFPLFFMQVPLFDYLYVDFLLLASQLSDKFASSTLSRNKWHFSRLKINLEYQTSDIYRPQFKHTFY